MRSAHQHSSARRRGAVVIIVLWSIAIAAIITCSVQLFGQRQATLGRESLERVQARWAARAGIEDTLAVMTQHTEKPIVDDARAMSRDMYYVSMGDTLNASYNIVHQIDGQNFGGPMDEHSKMNINRTENHGDLLVFDNMTLDVMDAITDWLDEDDDSSALGVERDYYLSLESPYRPRNGPMRTIGEMELIAGVWPKYFRGEDWNLNNRLDPNEDDGARSFPPDNPDGILDGGWCSRLTVYSTMGGATDSGQPRLYLRQAASEDLEKRLGISSAQAGALISYGKSDTATLADLLTTPLGGGASSANNANANGNNNNGSNNNNNGANNNNANGANNANKEKSAAAGAVPPLTEKQVRAVLAETSMEDPLDRKPGKMNINTVSSTFLRDILAATPLDEAIVDEVIYLRDSQPQGIVSILDLQKIPNITPDELKIITRRFDTTSNVFTISARGRSWASGLEVEIVAVVDRSTVPVRIIEYREQ